MKLPSFLNPAFLFRGGQQQQQQSFQLPYLQTDQEIRDFCRDHERVLLAYTARQSSPPGTYQCWEEAATTLFLKGDDSVAVAEVAQRGTLQDFDDPTNQMLFRQGDTFVTLKMSADQGIIGVQHSGACWALVQDGQLKLCPADDDTKPCPHMATTLVLQFRDQKDDARYSNRRAKSVFFGLGTTTAADDDSCSKQQILDFLDKEMFRSKVFANYTKGLPIWANRPNMTELYGNYPTVSDVGALHVQINEDTWRDESSLLDDDNAATRNTTLVATIHDLASRQVETMVGIGLEIVNSSTPSTVCEYERRVEDNNNDDESANQKGDEKYIITKLESAEQLLERFECILKREKERPVE